MQQATIRQARHKLGEADPPPRMTPRQIKSLLRVPDARTRLDRRDAALLAVLMGTGCRIGEALGLRVQDIEKGPGDTLLLILTTSKRRRRDPATGEKLPGPPRAVALPPLFAGYLRRYLAKDQARFMVFQGRQGPDSSLTVRAAQDAVSLHLHKIVPHFRVHDLRHAAASIMLRSSGNAWAVSRVLGHASIRYTETVYAHFITRDALFVAGAMADALSSRKGVAA